MQIFRINSTHTVGRRQDDLHVVANRDRTTDFDLLHDLVLQRMPFDHLLVRLGGCVTLRRLTGQAASGQVPGQTGRDARQSAELTEKHSDGEVSKVDEN